MRRVAAPNHTSRVKYPIELYFCPHVFLHSRWKERRRRGQVFSRSSVHPAKLPFPSLPSILRTRTVGRPAALHPASERRSGADGRQQASISHPLPSLSFPTSHPFLERTLRLPIEFWMELGDEENSTCGIIQALSTKSSGAILNAMAIAGGPAPPTMQHALMCIFQTMQPIDRPTDRRCRCTSYTAYGQGNTTNTSNHAERNRRTLRSGEERRWNGTLLSVGKAPSYLPSLPR